MKKYIIDNDNYEIILPGKGVTVTKLGAFCTTGGTGEPELYNVGDNGEKEEHHHIHGGGWICGYLRASDMNDHIAFKCPFRIVSCPLGCGKQLQEKDLELHSYQQCLFRQVKCQDCCKLLSLSVLDSHMLNVSSNTVYHHNDYLCGRLLFKIQFANLMQSTLYLRSVQKGFSLALNLAERR